MKRNQDKISLWKRKKRWTEADRQRYIYEQLVRSQNTLPSNHNQVNQYYQQPQQTADQSYLNAITRLFS